MAMSVTQVRLPEGLTKEVDKLVAKGIYATKSDAVRDAVRKFVFKDIHDLIGIIPNTGDTVQEVRKIRKNLSKEKFDLNEINSL